MMPKNFPGKGAKFALSWECYPCQLDGQPVWCDSVVIFPAPRRCNPSVAL